MSLLVTHNDLDGIAVAVIAIFEGYKGDIYIAPNPQQIPIEELRKYDDITVADLSPSEEMLKTLICTSAHIQVYDHHASASYIRNFEGCILDVNRCGSRIYAEEVYGERLNPSEREFIYRVDLWDRFMHQNSDFKLGIELNDLFNAINRNDKGSQFGYLEDTRFNSFIDRMLECLSERSFEYSKNDKQLIAREQAIYKQDYDATLSTLSERVDARSVKFAVCELPRGANSSLILNSILKQRGISYIIALYEAPPRATYKRISARAIDEAVDLNKLKFLSGHPRAAGGQLSIDFANKLLCGVIQAIDYR